MTRKPDAAPDEPEPPGGGRAAERLRQFERARGRPGPPETPEVGTDEPVACPDAADDRSPDEGEEDTAPSS